MAPLADQLYHNFPNGIPDSLLPPFVPATPEDAAAKLYSVSKYLYKKKADSVPDAIANIDARNTIIKLHDAILAENWQPFKGDLIGSLTETVERRRGEQ